MKIIQNIMPKLKSSYLTAAAVIAMTLPAVTKCDNSHNPIIRYTTTDTANRNEILPKEPALYNFYDYQADSMKIKHNLNDATVND